MPQDTTTTTTADDTDGTDTGSDDTDDTPADAGQHHGPRVTPLVWTPNPDHYAALAARNDYMSDWIGAGAFADDTYNPGNDIMPLDYATHLAGVSDHLVSDTDIAWATDHVGPGASEQTIETCARTKAFVDKLLADRHFGPFEHPHAMFAVEGISRACMAQLTRHRLASFDVQSFRYTAPDADHLRAIHREWADRWPEMREYVVVPRIFGEYGLDGPGDSERGGDSDGTDGEGDSDGDGDGDSDTDGGGNTGATPTTNYEQVYLRDQLDSFLTYQTAVERAVDAGAPEARAKEDARYLLPQGARVNLVVSTNLRQWLHVADMRAAADAHWEIRAVTEALLDHIESWAPMTMRYYTREMQGRKNRLAP